MKAGEGIHGQLSELAESKSYFRLRDIYLENRDCLAGKSRFYWDAVYHNLFGKEYASLRAANKYLSVYGDTDMDAGEMLYITALNRLRRFRYRAAAATYRKLKRLHGSTMSDEEKEEVDNNLAVCKSLRNVPPQKVEHNGIRRIPVVKTSMGHLTAKVFTGGHSDSFIIDTGANFSAVSRSAAGAMGLTATTPGIEVATATGIRIECGLAYAPQIDIEGITVHNAVFIIMEDVQLDFSRMGYSIGGIIGLPVLRQMGDLRFTANHIGIGNVRIPDKIKNNFCLEGLMPLTECISNGERLIFSLDTGANQSEYSSGYYTRKREQLEGRATELSGLRGGGGGVVRQKGLVLRDEIMSVGGRDIMVPCMNVIPDDYEFSRGKDGNMGLDALLFTGGFSISFKKMALYPAKKKRVKPAAK